MDVINCKHDKIQDFFAISVKIYFAKDIYCILNHANHLSFKYKLVDRIENGY